MCQRLKTETCHLATLLQPLVILEKTLVGCEYDFVEVLPKSQMKDVVFLVVDRQTKYVHFIPLSHAYIVAKVASLYMQFAFKLHGMPCTIVSDRDPVFTSYFGQS